MTKTVKYWLTGTRQPNFAAQGTPAELLSWIAGFPPSAHVPPLAVVNDMFRRGHQSGGFNGDTYWEPFELTPRDYEEFTRELLADQSTRYQLLDAPAWIRNELDWLAYVAWHERGIPLERYRRLLYRYDALTSAQRAARANGSRVAFIALTVRVFVVIRRMQRLLVKYADG